MVEVEYDGEVRSIKCIHCGKDNFIDIYVQEPRPTTIMVFDTEQSLDRYIESTIECPT